ncbi:MAG: hypothetical protein ABIJ81_03490 [Patescibacteria group bacterium]
MKIRLVVFIVLFTFVFKSQPAPTQNLGNDLPRASQQLIKYMEKPARPDRLKFYKIFAKQEIQLAFISAGNQYIINYSPLKSKLSYWIIPENGKNNMDGFATFWDEGVNGTADYGISGGLVRSENDIKYYCNSRDPNTEKSDDKYKQHWQKRLQQTIKIALNVLATP